MSDTKTSGLSALAATPATGDLFMVVDVSDTTMAATGTNKYLAASYVVSLDRAETLTNKTLTTPVIASFANAGHSHQDAAGGGQLDHGAALTGLGDDDHTQYLLATGTRTGASSQAQTFTNGIVGPTWKPASDSTTALQMTNAAGTVRVNLDTTNGRFTVGAVAANGMFLTKTSAVYAPSLTASDPNIVEFSGSSVSLTGATDNTTPFGFWLQTKSNTTNGLSYPLLLNPLGGSVGIGIRVPRVKLDVVGGGVNIAFAPGSTFMSWADSGASNAYRAAMNLAATSADWVFFTATGAAGAESFTERLRVLNATGYFGVGITAPTAVLHVAASTTARASICKPHGSAPTSPVNGDEWTTTAGSFVRINGTTHRIASGVTGSAFTQTYNTAARTVNAYTTDAESAYTGQDNAQAGSVYAKYADLEALRVAYTNLEASHLNLLQVVTALIDDAQAFSISG